MLNEYQINQEMNKLGYVCDKNTEKYTRYYNTDSSMHVIIFKNGKYTKQMLKVLIK